MEHMDILLDYLFVVLMQSQALTHQSATLVANIDRVVAYDSIDEFMLMC